MTRWCARSQHKDGCGPGNPQLTRQDSSAVGVQLTISRPVQRAAEAVAADTMTSGCILVLDTATAAVRASVSVPGYDPDDLYRKVWMPLIRS